MPSTPDVPPVGAFLGFASTFALGEIAIPTATTTMAVEVLAAGKGWRATSQVCTAGPEDRPVGEVHDSICIAAVMRGTFQYRTTQGSATLVPGSVLLGKPQALVRM